ncbi:uncharacterized protein NDAI_0F03130 [Naumovozyma dairenensis CBS 421]|uniref:Uncharacterized protein n=1 Tax=Naumovozyma dairenensis (strain ATCC 10597 / BCRC 20456 / CBS 421 / NBRC 0211 / NRRL Y-12639) TaxID=1071378 RepID=G0WCX0_NAUDC|nr:hypothetical protein NDAI_0F03130 [Naumovozyma dairenensis CBS 421]CCD25631.1 hypothetical protein NDAI_0F03130 [Naumovozyma dairenensis CBS 421]
MIANELKDVSSLLSSEYDESSSAGEESELEEAHEYFEQAKSFKILTIPTLFSIYDNDIISTTVDHSLTSPHVRVIESEKKKRKEFRLWFKFLILSTCGIIINEIFNYLNESTLYEGFNYLQWIPYSLQGISFGIIIPILDSLLFEDIDENGCSFKSIIGTFNIILGIAYGIRTISWESKMQMSIAWCLLNFILWLFLDNGTLSTILLWISSSLFGITIRYVTGIYVYPNGGDRLYFMNSLCANILIFGKLGRYLFQY